MMLITLSGQKDGQMKHDVHVVWSKDGRVALESEGKLL